MSPFRSLYARLAIGLILVLLVVGISYAMFARFMATRMTQSAEQVLNRHLADNLVQDKKIVQDGSINKQAMKQTFMEYMTINPSIEIYYLDLNGRILAYSAEPGRVKREKVALQPIYDFLNATGPSPLLGDDPRGHDRRKPFSVTPIPDAAHPKGYLYVVLQGEEFAEAHERQYSGYMLRMGGVVLAGSLVLGLILGLLIFNRLTLRLRRLQDRVGLFVDDDFQNLEILQTPLSKHQDEISALERRILEMATRIAEQWSALKQQDRLRREMVANISHDLRTPLASVQGYLETLNLKNAELDADQRAAYLNVASRQAHRLQRLIDNLFELAKLEAREHDPEFEVFSITELAYDVVNKLEIKAREKELAMRIETTGTDPQVRADIGMIERVLDNLISNAIYYSYTQGEIRIVIDQSTSGQVTVTVEDSGQGIPEDQQPLVFERFHQAHTPDRSNGHAGLGLAIVKKIIELHQQKVWVSSRPAQGAAFTFTLATG